MKLFELTGYKSHPTYQKIKQHFSRDLSKYGDRERRLLSFKDKLIEQGFTYHGMGQGGIVFEKEGYPWVFKLFTHDQAYLDFLNFAKQNQDNPLMPRIKGNLIKFDNQTYCVRLEKLERIPRNETSDLTTITTRISDYRDLKELFQYGPREYGVLSSKFPEVLQTITSLLLTYPNHALDLHGGNIMRRSNGSWVLIDPIA